MGFSQADLFTGKLEICTVGKRPTRSGLEEMEDRLLRKYKTKVTAVIEYLNEIGLPEPGEQFRIVTRRSFNALELVQYIATKEKIYDLNIAVYSINFQAAVTLLKLIDSGHVGKLNVLMSNLRNKAHREKEEIIKNKFTDHPRVSLFFCASHAKVMTCKTEAGNFYCMEGSGNLSFNSRVEQYVIDNDQELYKFSCQWMQEIKEFLLKQGLKELEIC